jgi:integrase
LEVEMASTWIEKRSVTNGVRYRVRFRLGGAESIPRYAGSFATKRDALIRKAWVSGEIAAMRVPDVKALAESERSPTLREIAERWQASRKDVRGSTAIQHQTALNRVYPVLGNEPYDEIAVNDVQRMVDVLGADGKARESIRKSKTVLAMVLDYVGVSPNPARDRRVKLPLEEPEEVEPPVAEHVEAVAWLLPAHYLIGLLVLDATGARIGEIEAARVGDLDESRRVWLGRRSRRRGRRAGSSCPTSSTASW